MLVNTLNEFSSGLEYPDGTRHDDALISTKKRLSGAQVYILDRDAVAMAANVPLSKPFSILSALPWDRLQFETAWIEFKNKDVRDAMADLGRSEERRVGEEGISTCETRWTPEK